MRSLARVSRWQRHSMRCSIAPCLGIGCRRSPQNRKVALIVRADWCLTCAGTCDSPRQLVLRPTRWVFYLKAIFPSFYLPPQLNRITGQRSISIELSTKVVDDSGFSRYHRVLFMCDEVCAERLIWTLVHEMCHAGAWCIDGVHRPPHGSTFKKWYFVSVAVCGCVCACVCALARKGTRDG